MSEDTAGTAESGKGEKEAGQSSKVRFFSLRRLWPLAVIACGVIAFFAFGLDSYVTFDMLKQNREWLLRQVDENRRVQPTRLDLDRVTEACLGRIQITVAV